MPTKVLRSGLEFAREACERAKVLAKQARKAEGELATALREIADRKLWRTLGYRYFEDFAERALGMSGGKARALIEVSRSLDRLPRVKAAFATGEICWTKCRQIARVATTATEDDWLRKGTLTNRELEREVAAAKGKAPLRRITIEVTEEELASFERANTKIREETDRPLTPGEVLQMMADRSVGAPVENPGYTLVIKECPRCATASRDAADGPVPVEPATLAAAKSDAVVVDLRKPETPRHHTITPLTRAKVIARDGDRCRFCGAPCWNHIHHTVDGRDDIDSLILLCSTCHKPRVHRGDLLIKPLGGGRFEFRLRDGTLAPGARECA